ncbi:MAG: hypothetical protein K0R61_56 [Microvirga sp.]|nr:hypothetical protein [Microvirga sp.]MDF2969606.1 hypothetical protein [Microvirga sp.]
MSDWRKSNDMDDYAAKWREERSDGEGPPPISTRRWNVRYGGGAASWSPLDLGSQLVGFFDFSRYGEASTVSDLVSGQAFTAAGSVALGTGLNGRRAAILDGTDDCFECVGIPTAWPTGANPATIFAVVNQTALVADTGTRIIAGWGTGAAATTTFLTRVVVSGQNRIRMQTGDNAVGKSSTLTADFSGRKLVIGTSSGTEVAASMDSLTSTPTAVVPAVGTTRTRLFAGSGAGAATFFQGDCSYLGVVAGSLSAGNLALLRAWGESVK